ncbi:MAG: M20 family metallopeptidase [Thalassobaculales bacterium]
MQTAAAALAEDPWPADLARLIAVDTSFPPGEGYGALADVLESLLAPLGFRCRRVEVPEALWSMPGGQARGARVNLIAARRTGRPVCSLYYHVDVVPAGEGWTRPPFALTREGERLYGRGTNDMKGTIAATLAALRAADAAGLPLAFDPVLLFCTDEEGGLYPGVRHLAEQGLIEGHVLCLNGGAAPRIWVGCFGSLDLAITVEGRAAHSGDPGNGINALEEALPIMAALKALQARVQQRASRLPPPPHHGGRPLTGRLTLAAVHAGAKGSALPGRCTILVNRRYGPEEDEEQVLAELRRTVEEAARGTAALSVETAVAGRLVPVENPDGPAYWPRWVEALCFGFGYAPGDFRRYGASSSSDMGFVQRAGIGEILLGGLSRPDHRPHGPDEFTTTGDVTGLARALLAYLTDSTPRPIP